MIKAAIFDIDGTLLDSTGIWRGLGERLLLELGITPREGLDEVLRCLSLSDGTEYLNREYDTGLSAGELLERSVGMVERFYLYEAQAKCGAEEMLALLSRSGIPMATATAGCSEVSVKSLERLGLRGYFRAEYSCADFGGKDNPRIFLAAADALGALPEETIVFEDSFHAALTAKNAGFIVAAVQDSGEPRQAELRECADFFGENLGELVPIVEQLLRETAAIS